MDGENHQTRSKCSFHQWMKVQEEDLHELLHALTLEVVVVDNDIGNNNDCKYTELVEKVVNHFQDYVDRRSSLSNEEASVFFAPGWCTSFENSTLWIAGCRPSSFIRLMYALSGCEGENLLDELMVAAPTGGGDGENSRRSEITGKQMEMISSLQIKTVKEEDRITSKLASLQENMVDHPLCGVAKNLGMVGEASGEVDHALDRHEKAMAGVMKEADGLRLRTLKELIVILTPIQAVDFLAASKKLHLCIHAWGEQRDHKYGRKNDHTRHLV